MVRTRDDDFVLVRFHETFPPLECLTCDGSRRPPTAFGSPLRRAAVVPIAQHQEEHVSRHEAVSLPASIDGKRPASIVNLRVLGINPFRIDPLAEPPLRLLA